MVTAASAKKPKQMTPMMYIKKLEREKKKLQKAAEKAEKALEAKNKKDKQALGKKKKKAVPPGEAKKAKVVKKKDMQTGDKKKEKKPGKNKTPLALLRLKGDLKSGPTQFRFGGVAGRSGRPHANRAMYDPSTGKKRVSPSKAKKKQPGLNPIRSTIDDRVETAKARVRGREAAKDKKNQCNVIEFMKKVADPAQNKQGKYADTKGLLVAHGMGSGKTLTSLWVAKEYLTKNRVNFVNILAPNVAVGEFIDSFERAGITPQMAGKIRVLTHDEFFLNRKGREFTQSLVIVDEAHLFTGLKYSSLFKTDVRYIMLLSGTPAPNTPSEIVPLINLLCRKKEDRWTTKKWDSPATTTKAKQRFLQDKVSMYNIGPKYNYLRERGTEFPSADNFPGYRVSTRSVKLSSSQNAEYIQLNKKVKKESQREREKHPFYARERKIVNTHPLRKAPGKGKPGNGVVTPKVAKVAKDVFREIKKQHGPKKSKEDPKRLRRGRLLLYAYNKETTVDLEGEIRRLCAEKKDMSPKIDLYNGSTSAGERLRIKEAFNNGETDVLIISKAGSVGLDLQCTSKVFMFDLWWNIPQMNQIIGRAIRYKSHQKPCEHEHVDVYIYQSVFSTKQPKGVKCFDAQVLIDASKKWKKVATMIEKIMKPASIKSSHVCRK